MSTRTYEIVPDPQGYLLIRLHNGKVALLDTGSPFTLGWDPEVEFGGKTYKAAKEAPFGANWDMATIGTDGMGGRIDFLLGTTAMREHSIVADTRAGVVKTGVKLHQPRMMYPLVGTLDDKPVSFILDTGAPVTFVQPGAWKKKEGVLRDFYPPIGWFEVPTRKLNAEVLGEKLSMVCADLPHVMPASVLTRPHDIAILGMKDLLATGRLGWHLEKGFISYERFH